MGKQAHTIVIIGCGNVAWHLAKQLRALHYPVIVYNHRANPALKAFASELGCKTVTGLDRIVSDAAFYMVCVSDSAIARVSAKITSNTPGAVVMHTSGSAELEELKNKGGHKAVFYPLQTFSRQDLLQWKDIPLILEAETAEAKKRLGALAAHFGKKIHYLGRKERLKLHLAAVFVNNFSNALYVAATDFTPAPAGKKNVDLLLPLIRQTTAKLGRLPPLAAQTGPAKRGDKPVMKKHLHLLRKHEDLAKIYRQLSRLIVKQQSHA